MKQVICCLLVLFCLKERCAAQTNTFPANGNVGVGTMTPTKKVDVIGTVKSDMYAFPRSQYDFSAAPRTQLESMSFKVFDDYNTQRPGGSTPDNNPYGTLLSFYGLVDHWETNIYIGAATKKMYFRTSAWLGGASEGGMTGGFHNWRTLLDSRSDILSTGRLMLSGSGNHYISNGNLGIGITTPSEKLAVNGNIRAKEIKVETANWPDYVFSDDYQLPGLEETEAYIKAHRRLPGMPSAEEAEREGISVGEMNRKLLEKVEELTLYLIKKNQELTEVRQLVFELRNTSKQQ